MNHFGWNNTLLKVDDTLSINDLIGSGTPFNNVTVGALLLHGAYGTSPDFTANQCEQMYFPVTSGTSAQYLRFSQMNLGGSGTNGLKWMAILGCNSLFHQNWSSMMNAGVKPYNSNLHLLLGSDSVEYVRGIVLSRWAAYMNFGLSTTNYAPLTIRSAWYQGAHDAFSGGSYANTIKFVVAGDTNCEEDMLQTNSSPQGVWFTDDPVQVWP